MKKLCLYLSLFLFIAFSAFAGENIIGGGYFDPGPGGGVISLYSMNTTGCSIATNLSGQNFNHPYLNRSYIDCAGVMQFPAINTARVEADGVLFEPFGANVCLQSRNLDTSPWLPASGVTEVQDQTGVDGQTNKAWTVEDNRGSAIEYLYQTFLISTDNPTVEESLFVKKDSTTDRFPEFRISFSGGISKEFAAQINTSTGATAIRLNDTTNGAVEVVDYGGDWWKIILTDTDTGSNSSFSIRIYPAAGDTLGDYSASARGTIVVDAVQLEIGGFYLGAAIGTSYIDNDGVAAGSDLASDGDCAGGTLTTGTGWSHDSGNNEYDATASTADLEDQGILTINEVYRIKTVWANITGGSVRVEAGGGWSPEITANGTYYHYLLASDTDLVFDAVTAFTGSLQEYEVIEYGTSRFDEGSNLTFDLPDRAYWFETVLGDTEYDTIFINSGYETYTTSGLDITSAVDTFLGGRAYDNIDLDLGKLYKITFNYTYNGGNEPYYRVAHDEYLTSLRLNKQMSGTGAYALYSMGAAYHGFITTSTPANFAVSNLNVQEVTNARNTGDGLYPGHGTSIIWWKPGLDKADGIATNYYLSTHGASGGQMIYTPAAGDPTSNPGGAGATVALAYTKDTFYKLAVQWGYIVNYVSTYRIGYDSGSGITWGTAQDYDGNWRIGALLILGRSAPNSNHIKRVLIYDSILTDGEIDALPAPTE